MDEVLCEQRAEITTDGARSRLGWVGCAHHGAHDLPGVLWAFDCHGNDWTAGHELDELCVETFAHVLFVVALKDGLVEGAKLHTHKAKALAFKTGGDGANETAFYGVGLEEDEGAI